MKKLSEQRRLKQMREDRGKIVNAFAPRLTTADVIPISSNRETADTLQESALELGRLAFTRQGAKAFECPIESAANHEAGHCILYRLLGYSVFKCFIEEHERPSETIAHFGNSPVWLGFSEANSGKWEVTPATDPLDDLDEAATQVAGVVAEMFFDKEYHQGSSLDEWALFKGICSQAAWKLGASHEEVSMNMLKRVGLLLRIHTEAHQKLANALIEDHNLSSERLADILSAVDPLGRRKMFFGTQELKEAA
jgi:hypothetical protein